MNNTLVSWLVRTVVVLGIVGATVATADAAKPNFEGLSGTYKGNWIIVASPITYATTITADVSANKSGKKMTVTLSGILVAGMQSVPIQTTLKFDDKRKVKGTGVLMGFAGPAATNPARFSGKPKNLKFTLTAAPGATLIGTLNITGTSVVYTLKLTKKTLSITGVGTIIQSGNPPLAVQILINLRRSGKN